MEYYRSQHYEQIVLVVDGNTFEFVDILKNLDIQLVALRCAGFNNVDLEHKGNIRESLKEAGVN